MIDWAKVDELRAEIGAEDFAEVVEIFLEEVDEAIGRLQASLPEAQLECCLHFLKGSALNLGFEQFSDLCSKGETAAANGDFHHISIPEIVQSYDLSKAAFIQGLAKQSAA